MGRPNKIEFFQFTLPVCVGREIALNRYRVDGFAGSCFFLNRQGWIATCRHVLTQRPSSEVYVCKYLPTGELCEIHDIQLHERLDLAIGRLDLPGALIPRHLDAVLPGLEVIAMGFVPRGMQAGEFVIDTRFGKGYLQRVAENDVDLPTGRWVCETSFPSLPGFSGTPLLTDAGDLVGMMYGNLESHIETFSYTERDEGGVRFHEKINRVVEFGLAHALEDLVAGVKSLGVDLG